MSEWTALQGLFPDVQACSEPLPTYPKRQRSTYVPVPGYFVEMDAMQTFSFPVAHAGNKQYVFVDEHNRHKRLKVMRACEGCRRRKIKCDAATTNTWPCAACTRLKLQCVPPPSTGENDYGETGIVSETDGPGEQPNSAKPAQATGQPPESSHNYVSQPQMDSPYSSANFIQSASFYAGGVQQQQYTESFHHPYQDTRHSSDASDGLYRHPSQASMHSMHSLSRVNSVPQTLPPDLDLATAEDLTDQLGELKITENGIALYLRQTTKPTNEPEAPIQDAEVKLPALTTEAGSQIRIPPALMPSDDDALHYFQVFFRDVHPYMPVINRNHFYHQWHNNRDAISPLLLEAVFACAGRMSEEPSEGAQWLALANKHEESFLDKPRLSTIQALILLLKAREAEPKSGYYYRSWMTCKKFVSMCKDLELHEHHDLHQEGEACGSNPVECLTKTRIWQTALVVEMMVGSPQGRSDMGVDPKTVDISTTPPCYDTDDYEQSLSRQFAYFIRNAYTIRLIGDKSRELKKKKDWGLDPEFVGYNVAFNRWPSELPADLQVIFLDDHASPVLPSHFIGNMHAHYQLGIVMFHRPQLEASKSFATDTAWKHHMSTCYNSAKLLCRLQEAILAKFGLTGLLCMIRGINFTVYAIITCTMLHLIAITSPDPEFNNDARGYFTRHMRILEQCLSEWSLPETEAQINALRVAFSADISKPFELRSSFPYSPSDPYRPSPPLDAQPHYMSLPPTSHPDSSNNNASHASYFMTPPVSSTADSKPHTPDLQQGYMPNASFVQNIQHSTYHSNTMLHTSPTTQWNPTPIIDQFNTAFAIPPSALAPPHSHSQTHTPTMPMSSIPPQMHPPNYNPSYSQSYIPPVNHANSVTSIPQSLMMPPQQHQQHHQTHHQPYPTDSPVFVTPKEWQHSVASVFDPAGLKRRWDYNANIDEQMQKRTR